MIKIQNLCKNYGPRQILKNVNLHVARGECVAIIGPSGAGKSSLLRCVNRFTDFCSGQIFADGADILSESEEKIRQKIGTVFQNFSLFPHFNVLKNLIFAPLRLKILPHDEAISRAHEILQNFSLQNFANVRPHELSGGQKQRVHIARALMMAPKILLFDEPTSALDPENAQNIAKILQNLAKNGQTMLVITHDHAFARTVAHRIFQLKDGDISQI